MNRSTKIKLAAGAISAVVVAGGGAAIAATQPWSPKEESQAVIDDAARQLGIEPRELSDALKQALENQIDAAVEAGRLTKEHGEALKERLESADVPLIFPGFGGKEFVGPFGSLETAASYLGLGNADLRSRLNDGKTLAEIARDRGKSVDGLVQALVEDASEKLDAIVEAGKLTRAQADELKADLEERMTDLVNGELRFHDRGMFRGPGFRFPGHGFRPRSGSFDGGPWLPSDGRSA